MAMTIKQVVKRLKQINTELSDNNIILDAITIVPRGEQSIYQVENVQQERASLLSERRILKLELLNSNVSNDVVIDDGNNNRISISAQDLYEMIKNNKDLYDNFETLKFKAINKPANTDINYDINKSSQNLEILKNRIEYLEEMLELSDLHTEVEV